MAHEPDSREEGHLLGTDEARLRAGMAAIFLSNVLFACVRARVAFTTGKATPYWINALSAVLIGIVYLWHRRDERSRTPSTVSALIGIATVGLLVPVAYGVASSVFWLSLVAIGTMLLAQERLAKGWLSVLSFATVAASFLEPYVQHPRGAGESDVDLLISRVAFFAVAVGLTLAFVRIAEQRAVELAEALVSLQRANAARARFLAHVSHELRTPLHGVLASCELATRSEAPEVLHEHVHSAEESARMLLLLLNNLLDVTQAESGSLSLASVPFSLGKTMLDAVGPFEARAAGKGLSLELRADGHVHDDRIGDPARLSQVVMNLVGNAIKFTDAGQVSITVKEARDGAVQLEVRDSGRGIAPSDRERIFEPFVQLERSDGSREVGAGLGLSIVRELVGRMGGRIFIGDAEAVGTCFVVVLPLPIQEGSALLSSGRLQRPAAPHRISLFYFEVHLTVILCEDNEVNTLLLQTMLERVGHRVLVARDGAEGLERTRSAPIDLVITDIEMPVMDGITMTKKLRERERELRLPPVPVIGATAHAGHEIRDTLLEAGITELLVKPFGIAELESAMRRARRVPSPGERPLESEPEHAR